MKMGKKEFILSLNECKVDKNITINFMDEFGVADKFGSKFFTKTPDTMLTVLRQLGANVSDVSYKDDKWLKGEIVSDSSVEVVKEEVVKETPVEGTEVIEENEGIVLEEVQDKPDVDWEWIATLKNNTPSKKELDKYAKEKFNIDLNRRMTLENMVADLKTQLGVED